jgi:hypothetical protein
MLLLFQHSHDIINEEVSAIRKGGIIMKTQAQRNPVSAERGKQTQPRQICQRSGELSADHGRAESEISEGGIMFSKHDVYTTVQSLYCYPDSDVLKKAEYHGQGRAETG